MKVIMLLCVCMMLVTTSCLDDHGPSVYRRGVVINTYPATWDRSSRTVIQSDTERYIAYGLQELLITGDSVVFVIYPESSVLDNAYNVSLIRSAIE